MRRRPPRSTRTDTFCPYKTRVRSPAAARERLVLAANPREVGARAGAVLEQTRLADPEVHDSAVVHEIVTDRLDEAGVRLGMLVGAFRAGQPARAEVETGVDLDGGIGGA